MREEQLIVKKRRHRKYNSYKGEITPAVDNLIKRNLSPIIDCFDGMPVCWTVGTSPNADLANTMLKCAISTLKPDEHPINEYMDWYCTSRIKSTLGGLSPLEYRRRLGVGV